MADVIPNLAVARPKSHIAFAITALALISIVPLLWPSIPPLTDMFASLGRYSVAQNLPSDPFLQRFFSYNWAVIPNLGVDLLVFALAPLLGLELAAKLIVIMIVAISVVALLLLGYQAHKRITPTALLALPLIYGLPLQIGLLNYCLSMAFALLFFWLWKALGTEERLGIRSVVFVPLSIIVWLSHAVGWGVFGILAGSAELVRRRDNGDGWWKTLYGTVIQCLPLLTPAVLMAMSRTAGGAGLSSGWFDWKAKHQGIITMLLDRWQQFDLISIHALLFVIAAAIVLRKTRWDRSLALAAILLTIAYILLPWELFGSAWVDVRVAAFVVVFALLAIDIRPATNPRVERYLLLAAFAFLAVRTSATTISFYQHDQELSAQLEVLPHIPMHSRVIALIEQKCEADWGASRLTHMPSMALVRRRSFINDQFGLDGAQLLSIHYQEGKPFIGDPSQSVADKNCKYKHWPRFAQTIQKFPRSAFDYVWAIGVKERRPAVYAGLTPVWRKGDSALYRIDR